MATKHPVAKLFTFAESVDHRYRDDEELVDRLNIYLDYVADLDVEGRVQMYEDIAHRLNNAFPQEEIISRRDLVTDIPPCWPCIGWFRDKGLNVRDGYDEGELAVFDYDKIIRLLDNEQQTLMMLFVVDAVRSDGNPNCGPEMASLIDEIRDENLLSKYGYNGGTLLLTTAQDLVEQITPTGGKAVKDLMNAYSAGSGGFDSVLKTVTDLFTDEEKIGIISKEMSENSVAFIENPNMINDNIDKVQVAMGFSNQTATILKNVSTEAIENHEDVLGILTSHASNITGISEEIIVSAAQNIRKHAPIDELNEMGKVVTDSLSIGDKDTNE